MAARSDDSLSFRSCLRADLIRFRTLALDRPEQTDLAIRDWLTVLSPRFAPMLLHRIAYFLQTHRLGPLAKIVSLINFVIFGIEIATRCPIGGGLFFPHTQGTVIGAWRIGRNATIYQGVTLGAKELDFGYEQDSRPVLGHDVMIGSGAKVLGGVKIGDGVRVGANAVVTKSLLDQAVIVGAQPRILERNDGFS